MLRQNLTSFFRFAEQYYSSFLKPKCGPFLAFMQADIVTWTKHIRQGGRIDELCLLIAACLMRRHITVYSAGTEWHSSKSQDVYGSSVLLGHVKVQDEEYICLLHYNTGTWGGVSVEAPGDPTPPPDEGEAPAPRVSYPRYPSRRPQVARKHTGPLRRHGDVSASEEEVWHRCKICFTSYTSKRRYISHMRHRHGKFFSCGECDVCFTTLEAKKRHGRQQHSDEPGRYKCPARDCDKSFIVRSLLKKHSLVHKPQVIEYPCTDCAMAFKYKTDLKKHLAIHKAPLQHCRLVKSGGVPCTYSTRDAKLFQAHETYHMFDDDEYRCLCGNFTGKSRTAMKRHRDRDGCTQAHVRK